MIRHHGAMTETPWLTVASTLGVAGAAWQTIVAAQMHIDSMRSFLGDHNEILREEKSRAIADVPAWRILKRRRVWKRSIREVDVVLTEDELLLLRRYDSQAWGWSLVLIAALIAAAVGWTSIFS